MAAKGSTPFLQTAARTVVDPAGRGLPGLLGRDSAVYTPR